VTEQVQKQSRVEALIESGKQDAEVCEKCTALVGGYNKEKNLSSEQIQAIISQFATIDFCLSKKMPKTAKQLISAMKTDEYSEELKVLLLEVLKEF
jgi:protein-arginine kinase activator protein McsA